MKFEEWYKQFYGGLLPNSDRYFVSESAWIASKNHLKQEILKILNDKNAHDLYDLAAIKEIEKL